MPRNPCSYLPRRLQIVASLTSIVLFCIIFLGTSSSDQYDPYLNNVPYGPKLQSGAHVAVDAAHQVVDRLPKLPNSLNPFGQPAHSPPPEQANSTSGDAKWFSDWKWQNPFSSSITLDEERSVLPPEKNRPPIYTYFDLSGHRKDEKSVKAERELLQIWRRAWWAKGFKPLVLGQAEARNNPLYRTLMGKELEKEMEFELQRWLAWSTMGSGILCNWLTLPMGGYDDALVTFLRRGEYPALTRYEGLENGLFVGPREEIDKAIKGALANEDIKKIKSFITAVPDKTFKVDKHSEGIAFYSTANIKAKYALLRDKFDAGATSEALSFLPQLINSHLHQTWQALYPSGIAVLKPIPQHTTSIIEPAIDIARNLSTCPSSPIPASCPPNKKTCRTCVASQEQAITTPPVFRNTSTLFTIATIPHPYTTQSLLHSRDDLNVKFVRRETNRDLWILAATKELLGTGLSSFARLTSFKDIVASDFSSSRTLWLTAETPFDVDDEKDMEALDWLFGFQLPRGETGALKSGKSETPVPGPERRPPPPKQEFEGTPPSEKELKTEQLMLDKARTAIHRGSSVTASLQSKQKVVKRNKGVVEAWNLADTEAWKFVRAYNARKGVERERWEEEEEAFLGKGMFGRFVDKITRSE